MKLRKEIVKWLGRNAHRPGLLISVAIGCIVVCILAAMSIGKSLREQFAAMDDPTERGLFYIAIAIFLHAIISDDLSST